MVRGQISASVASFTFQPIFLTINDSKNYDFISYSWPEIKVLLENTPSIEGLQKEK